MSPLFQSGVPTKADHSVAPAIPAETSLEGSLQTLLLFLEQAKSGMRTCILILGEDGKNVRLSVAPMLPTPPRLLSAAFFSGERMTTSALAADPLWTDFHAIAATHKLVACWANPIQALNGAILGSLLLFFDRPPGQPSSTDIVLLDTATRLAADIVVREQSKTALQKRVDTAEGAAESVRESEIRFRAMAETVPVHIWTAQPDGQLDFVTDKLAEYYALPKEELLGNKWARVVHPEDVESAGARWAHSLQTGEAYEVEFRVFYPAGDEYRWNLVRAQPHYEGDRIVRWFGCNADIEDYKRIESARDAALTETKAANKAKANFLAMMSHELRTPLNAVGGYAQLMLDGIPTPAAPEHHDYLRRIERSQKHLLGLIDSVLTHAKIESGRMTYHNIDVTVGEILDEVEPLIAPQRNAKGLSYSQDKSDLHAVFRGDKEKVVQIILNILSNAAKFTPAGGSIAVNTNVTPSTLAISVTDTGIGLSPDQVAQVFEPFVQFQSALGREHKGTGLGMPISRELARGMGGDLSVTSELNAGSTFVLTLPVSG